MPIDTLWKILFGSILTIASWDVLRRNLKNEIKKGHIMKSPLHIFLVGLVTGVAVLILGIFELLR